MALWSAMRQHMEKRTVYTGPLLPRTFPQALAWLRGRPKLQVGFKHALRRNDVAKLKVVELLVDGLVAQGFYEMEA